MSNPTVNEIEAKFAMDSEQIAQLVTGFERLGESVIEDTYYDTADFRLTTRDIWLRRRVKEGSEVFEAKVGRNTKPKSPATNYDEIPDPVRIAVLLEIQPDQVSDEGLRAAGFLPFCECRTNRAKWVSGIFTVDVDNSSFPGYPDFSYPVVEVEVDYKDVETAVEYLKDLFRSRLLNFEPLRFGKIVEFLRVNKPEHFYALLEAGVVAVDSKEELDVLMRKEESEPGQHGMTM